MDLNNLPEFSDELMKTDFSIKSKKGWFFTPLKSYYTYGLAYSIPFLFYETENDINSESFANSLSHSGKKIMTKKQREVSKKFIKDEHNDYPLKNLTELSLIFKFAIKNIAWFKLDLSYHEYSGVLMHNLNSKKFFPVGSDDIKDIKEVSVIYNRDFALNTRLALQIPIWGATIDQGGFLSESFYYMILGYSNSQILKSKNKQFYQLANYNNDIRYHNGKDTIGFHRSNKLSTLNYSRDYIELGLGVNIEVAQSDYHYGYSLDLLYSYPLSSVVSDATWKQHFFRLQWNFYLKGFHKNVF